MRNSSGETVVPRSCGIRLCHRWERRPNAGLWVELLGCVLFHQFLFGLVSALTPESFLKFRTWNSDKEASNEKQLRGNRGPKIVRSVSPTRSEQQAQSRKPTGGRPHCRKHASPLKETCMLAHNEVVIAGRSHGEARRPART